MKSWQSLLKAANIRKHETLLQIAKTVPDNVVPHMFYHRQCRILFMMKRDLHQIMENEEIDKEINETTSKMILHRMKCLVSEGTSCVYAKICMIYDKKVKYMKGIHTREPLTKCTDLECDSAIRKAAIASRELVAARAHYH